MKKGLMRSLLLMAIVAIALVAVVEVTEAQPGPSDGPIFVSTAKPGRTEDGVSYGREDILALADDEWHLIFDGSDYGLDSKRHNINAFAIPLGAGVISSSYTDTLPFGMFSFSAPQTSVPDIPAKVTAQDIVAFENYSGYNRAAGGAGFFFFFDGSNVGLNTASERIDGISFGPDFEDDGGIVNHDCSEGILLVSTVGTYVVPAANGGFLKGSGSDILLFCMIDYGYKTTRGYWYKAFDSFTAGVTPRHAIDTISVLGLDETDDSPLGNDDVLEIFFGFTTKSKFSASGGMNGGGGTAGSPSDLVFAESYYLPGSGSAAMFMNFGSANQRVPRLNGVIDAGEFLFDGPAAP